MKGPAYLPGLFFGVVFFAVVVFFATRCCGGVFATAVAARSKRAHASGCNSMSLEGPDFDMQPLSRVKNVRVTNWGQHSPMIMRPAISSKVAQYIAHWTEIETKLGMFLALLLHTNEQAILAMYIGIENRAAQLRMINSAAGAVLPTEHNDVISVFLTTEITPTQKYRDKLAHWCWGYSDELPDSLLIRHPRFQMADLAKSLKSQAAYGLADVPTDNSNTFVIREPDLVQRLEHLTEIETHVRWAMATVWDHNAPQERAEYLRQLSNTPLVRSGLDRLNAGRQKTQTTQ